MSSSSDEDGNGSGGSDWSSNASSSDYGGALSDADADGSRASAANAIASACPSPPMSDDVVHHQNHPQPQPNCARRSQRARHWTAGSGAASAAIAAYTEALRTTASHRESISTGAASGAIYMLSEDTRRRHRDSKKRVEAAERTQQLLLKTHELGAVADDVPLWVHACVIPPRWRQQIVAHVAPIRAQMAFCQERVLGAWQLLLPPFDRANLAEFEARVALLERSIALLEAALVLCQQQAEAGEREAASGFIQLWYRQRLAKRGFYTRTVRIGRRERGLIPGLFDSTVGLSKLTVDHRRHQATLEFPAPSAPTSTPRAPAFR